MSDQNELQPDYDPEYEELLKYFKSNNLISDSPSVTVRPGRVKITADGVVIVDQGTNMRRRNLKAVLTLPDLKERASYSSHKWLYELSLKLAEDPPSP
ncbi:GL15151 [Drosophila persimilis]|uniref:GL15151 n=1 Tax=Drosophila persimilis TaxID=7234 RepID=B4H3S1_DROPE|nr:uncharacterized protein LOC6600341 [Drosophila persimilis]EDW31022.1 GL15151 [Drosophila persimilis]